ncbi:MAG TPA: serine protease [Oculatellaceae cyanobacterium]
MKREVETSLNTQIAQEGAGETCEADGRNINIVNLCKDAVRIFATKRDGSTAQGSGTLMSAKGDIVTSDHDITDADVTSVEIQFSGKEHRTATLVGRNGASGTVVYRVNGGADKLPQPYYTLKFAQTGGDRFLSPTIAFLYPKRSLDPVVIRGVLGDKVPFGVMDSNLLSARTPLLDRSLMAERIFMPTTTGDSGGAVALESTGEIVGLVQYARTERSPQRLKDPTVLDQALLTPADRIIELLSRVDNQ